MMSDSLTGLRAALREQQLIVSTFVMMPRVEIVEMLGSAGFDAVVFDLEHGPLAATDLAPLAAAARGVGLASIARLGEGRPANIGAALDAGVDGVMVPHIESAQHAENAVSFARFPPDGTRSLNPYVRGTDYGSTQTSPVGDANSRSAVIGMIEDDAGTEQLDEILEVDGLDAVFVGPVDLAGRMGYPGEPDHPVVVAQIEAIFTRVKAAGRAGGVYVSTPETASRWVDRGASLVAVSADVAMAFRAFVSTRRRIGDDAQLSEPT